MKTEKRVKKICESAIFAAKTLSREVIIADIATDHGFIAEEVSKQSIVKKVIATDISEKSLGKLKKLILLKKISKIDTVLGDGLNPIEDDIDVCIIAGIGGYEIKKMIETQNKNLDGQNKCNIFVLQPAQNSVELRNWIFDNNFYVINDIVIEDSERFYPIISIDISKVEHNEKTIFNLWIGRDSLQNLVDLRHFLMFLKEYLRFSERISIERIEKDEMLFQKYELYKNIDKYLLDLEEEK